MFERPNREWLGRSFLFSMLLGSLPARAIKRISQTLKWEMCGVEHWNEGAILVCWHGQLVLAAALIQRLGRAGQVTAPIVREYGQSAVMTTFAQTLGLRTLYIPSYVQPEERRAALLALAPAVRSGQSLFMATDGHRAPARMVRADLLEFAASARLPILPFAIVARPSLTLPTWDRKALPLLYSRVGVAIGYAMRGTITVEILATRLQEMEVQAHALID